MARALICCWVVMSSVVASCAMAETSPYAGSRRYGAYLPPAKYVHQHAAELHHSIYAPPSPYLHGYYDLPYRIRYGLYRPWYQSYYPPRYHRYYHRPWYTFAYPVAEPIHAAPAEPCYDGCYYW